MFVPIFLITTAFTGFGTLQIRQIQRNYGMSSEESVNLANSVHLYDKSTAREFESVVTAAKNNPSLLEDEDFLQGIDATLAEKASFLLVKKGSLIVHGKDRVDDGILQLLEAYDFLDPESGVGTFIDSGKQLLIKQIVYKTDSGLEGSAYIITATNHMIPEIRKLLYELTAAMVAIFILTAILLIMWVYRSMVTPIKELQEAAENIKEGNLDFTIDIKGDDEIKELAVSFEEMRQRLKLNAEEKLSDERENRALISNIAHDLKTPITAVKGYAEGIMDGVANTPEKVDKYVRTIYNKAIEMDTLINELTLYSKIDTNRIPYNFAKIPVKEYFEDCIEEIGLDLEAKGIALGYYNYLEEEAIVIADPEQLRRVIHNIISNSAKYSNKKQSYIHIRVRDVGDFIQVEMEDNGRGIAKRDLPYIFDRFYRADASRNSATGGSGIGLSIVKKIIEDHGGKIWATSTEDVGTTMYFVLRKYEEACNEKDIDY